MVERQVSTFFWLPVIKQSYLLAINMQLLTSRVFCSMSRNDTNDKLPFMLPSMVHNLSVPWTLFVVNKNLNQSSYSNSNVLAGFWVRDQRSILCAPRGALPVTVTLCRLGDCRKKDGNQGGLRRTMTTATAMWVGTGKQGRRGTGTASRTSSARTVHLQGCRS